MWLVVGAAAPVVATFLWLRPMVAPHLGIALTAALSCALGLGAASVLYWVLLQLTSSSTQVLARIDLAVWGAIAIVGAVVGRRAGADRAVVPATEAAPASTRVRRIVTTVWAAVLALGATAVASITFVANSLVVPHGEWDAWTIWNVRARNLYRGVPDAWRDGFTLAPHVDYPLLGPASVARGWAFLGSDNTVVPIAFGLLCGLLIAVVAGVSIGRRSTAAKGLLAVALILATPSFVVWLPSQGADIATSLYFLLTLVLFALAREHGAPQTLWACAGASAACAAWTKNEGIAFCVVFGMVLLLTAVVDRRWIGRWRALGLVALGAAPILSAVAAFKWWIPISNDLVRGQSIPRTMELLGNWARIQHVVAAFAHEAWTSSATTIGTLPVLLAFVVVGGIDVRRLRVVLPVFGAVLAMAAVDMLVYVLTPQNLNWHLQTSLSRVVLQLTPLSIWAGIWLTGNRGAEESAS